MQLKNISGGLFVDYSRSMRGLATSAKRLSSGKRLPSDGAGDFGIAERMKQTAAGTNALVTSLESGKGVMQSRETALQGASEIVGRIYELSLEAQDPTRTVADRYALDTEAQALLSDLKSYTNLTYDGTRKLFGATDADVLKFGVNSADTLTFGSTCFSLADTTAIQIASKTFDATVNMTAASDGYNLANTANAASWAALIDNSSGTRVIINNAMSRVGAALTQIARTQDNVGTYLAGINNSESAIRDTDVAKEAGNFTEKQVRMSAGQSIIAQANNFSQGTMRFFQ